MVTGLKPPRRLENATARKLRKKDSGNLLPPCGYKEESFVRESGVHLCRSEQVEKKNLQKVRKDAAKEWVHAGGTRKYIAFNPKKMSSGYPNKEGGEAKAAQNKPRLLRGHLTTKARA